MNYKARRAASIIFGLTSAIGTIVTAILVAKETPKALKVIDKLKAEKKTRKRDYIKALIPVYWPAGAVCLGTIASTTVSQIVSIKTEASLLATSAILSQGWNRYKYKVKDFIGPKAEKLIRAEIAQEDYNKDKQKIKTKDGSKRLYYEEHLGFFYADPVELQAGLEDINQRLYTPDPKSNDSFYWATLYLFAKDAKADVINKDKLNACRRIGWTAEIIKEMYVEKFVWIHPEFTHVFDKETAELSYTMITFMEEPIVLIEEALTKEYYKNKYQYMHDAESDINFVEPDEAALDLFYKGNKWCIEQTIEETNGRAGPIYKQDDVYYEDPEDNIFAANTFSSSSPTNKEHVTKAYIDGTTPSNPNRVEYDLPDIQELSKLQENNNE